MITVGIDPGMKGAIAAVCSSRGLLEVENLPICPVNRGSQSEHIDETALRRMLQRWSLRHEFAKDDVVGVIERMSVQRPGENRASPVALLKMGDSAGVCRGVLAAFTHRRLLVMPSTWKKALGLTGKPKSASVEEAKRRYPVLIGRIRADRAEAILIATWGLGEINGVVRAPIIDPLSAEALA